MVGKEKVPCHPPYYIFSWSDTNFCYTFFAVGCWVYGKSILKWHFCDSVQLSQTSARVDPCSLPVAGPPRAIRLSQRRASPRGGSVAPGAAGARLGELKSCRSERSLAQPGSPGSLREPDPRGRLSGSSTIALFPAFRSVRLGLIDLRLV